ncbi:hypothetical protein J6590_044170, partial [Homalodisca vitripennis]
MKTSELPDSRLWRGPLFYSHFWNFLWAVFCFETSPQVANLVWPFSPLTHSPINRTPSRKKW